MKKKLRDISVLIFVALLFVMCEPQDNSTFEDIQKKIFAIIRG